MRIGIVVNTSWNIFNFRKGLIEHFKKEGIEIIAIAPYDDYSRHLIDWGCDFERVKIYSKGANPLNDIFLVKSLYSIYKKRNLDVVLHFTIKPNIYGALAAKLAGIPSINNVTGLGTVFIRDSKKSKIAKLLYFLAFKFPSIVFFQNDDDRTLFIKKSLVDKAITDVLPGSGINLNHFSQNALPIILSKRKTKFKFLMVSRLLYDKGITEYVEAARKLGKQGINATFQILGGLEPVKGLGVTQKEVDSWVDEGVVEHLGRVDDVREILNSADCIVLPSYREGTPRSLIEACSMGKPIVTTNVAGCRETVIEGYNGFFCKPMSSADLAEKMFKMYLLNPTEREQMGKNSRKLAEDKFDQQKVIQKYMAAIYAALGQKENATQLKKNRVELKEEGLTS